MKVVLMMGLQASGKTTYCKEHFEGFEHISLDYCKTRVREERLFQDCILQGRSCVVDNTNPTRKDRERYIRIAKIHGVRIEGYFMRSRVADCIERNFNRLPSQQVPRLAIAGTSNKLQMPSYDEGFDDLYFVSITESGFSTSPWRTR